jgi:hypothetical protein
MTVINYQVYVDELIDMMFSGQTEEGRVLAHELKILAKN